VRRLREYSAFGPGKSWHGATGTIREGETGEEAIDRLIAKFEGRLCPRCEHALRVCGIYRVCAAGCGWQTINPTPEEVTR
jgi:hypothetical protein